MKGENARAKNKEQYNVWKRWETILEWAVE
jgi:hypothetical protein